MTQEELAIKVGVRVGLWIGGAALLILCLLGGCFFFSLRSDLGHNRFVLLEAERLADMARVLEKKQAGLEAFETHMDESVQLILKRLLPDGGSD